MVPDGQLTPAQGSAQTPSALQIWPGWQGLSAQALRTQYPSRHRRSAGQRCVSSSLQAGRHSPVMQVAPAAHSAPVSTTPSQSLSLPSQISGWGPTPPRHSQPRAPTQMRWPGRHSPSSGPAGTPGGRHSSPVPGRFSSTLPLQLLSRPSQTSSLGPTGVQTRLPSTQRVVPWRHSPTWLPHSAPTPGKGSSSTNPSQSLSSPSQTSSPGVVDPTLHTVPVPTELQIFLPTLRQAPCTPLSHSAPTSNPSSVMPSQSLSLPSHTSALGVTASRQLGAPVLASQTSLPVRHSPTQVQLLPDPVQPTTPAGKQESSGVGSFSSTRPSQLLSRLSQGTSAMGAIEPRQTLWSQLPITQACSPGWHWPLQS